MPNGGTVDDGRMRKFASGATRDSNANKLSFLGFDHPRVDLIFADYMHVHRTQSDGTIRDSDNWQKGIPVESYIESLLRHVHDVRMWERGEGEFSRDADVIAALCAIRFNVNGLIFELTRPGSTYRNYFESVARAHTD